MFSLIAISAISVIAIIYWKLKNVYNYWSSKGIKQTNPIYILGDWAPFLFQKLSLPELKKQMYDKFVNERYFGMYQFFIPTLVIRDSNLIKQITVKEFDHFTDHRPIISEDIDPLFGKNLLTLTGQRWRDMRATLSPAFTSSKMKAMFILISETADQFIEHFLKLSNSENSIIPVEMKDTFSRFTTDVIATTAFGLKCDSLEDKQNDFFKMGKEALDFNVFKTMKLFMYSISPFLMKLFKLKIIATHLGDYFSQIIINTMKVREQQGIIRPDMIHLLMKARKGELKHEDSSALPTKTEAGFSIVEESHIGKSEQNELLELSDEDIVAQALAFFLAGFDTSSTLMCYMSYELALNPDIQDRLLVEIDETLENCGGKLTYEALHSMKYMDMVVSECLRKWPPLFATDRKCISPFTIEPKMAGESPVHLEKGDLIWIPIYSMHRDPKYYPDPERFDPERFNEDNKGKINQFAYIPFGAGPRACIGSRFALMECKAVFISLLSKFNIVVTKKTQIPITLSKKSFNMASEKGFWLGLQRRNTTIPSRPTGNCWKPPFTA